MKKLEPHEIVPKPLKHHLTKEVLHKDYINGVTHHIKFKNKAILYYDGVNLEGKTIKKRRVNQYCCFFIQVTITQVLNCNVLSLCPKCVTIYNKRENATVTFFKTYRSSSLLLRQGYHF